MTLHAGSLIFASQDGRVRSWHFDRRTEQVSQLACHQREVWALAYTPDGATLLSAGDDHSIKVWDSWDGRLRSTFDGHDSLVTSLAVNPGGTLLASASFDKTLRLWNLPGGRPGPTLRGHTDRVRAVAFSAMEKPWPRPARTRPSGSGTRRPARRSPSSRVTRKRFALWYSTPAGGSFSRAATTERST